MSGVIQLCVTFLNAVTCGAIGAVTYKIFCQNGSQLAQKIQILKGENEQLRVKIWSLERINNDWEIAWLNQFNEKREMSKCQG